MRRRILLLVSWLSAAVGFGLPFTAAAGTEEWNDTQGNRFRGEPAEELGPLALFRTPHMAGRRLPFHVLSPEDCVRFSAELRTHPPRAADWAHANGLLSRELVGNLLRVENDQLVPADLSARPEPEFLILFFASHSEGPSWEMMGSARPLYEKIQKDYPGMVEAVFYGTSDTKADHIDMAVSMRVPWLVTEFHSQRSMSTVSGLISGAKYGLTIVNRDGVPLFSSSGDKAADVKQAMNDLLALLDLLRPANPRAWQDRAYYLRAVQQAAYAQGRCDPVLVGNPLLPEGLRQRAVFRFDATIQVAADGHVTAAALKPGGDLPSGLEAPLGQALQKALFVPAVDHGKFVDGAYQYHFEVSR